MNHSILHFLLCVFFFLIIFCNILVFRLCSNSRSEFLFMIEWMYILYDCPILRHLINIYRAAQTTFSFFANRVTQISWHSKLDLPIIFSLRIKYQNNAFFYVLHNVVEFHIDSRSRLMLSSWTGNFFFIRHLVSK